ncbi:DoxX family protein [Paraliomyxa miuraensis]|uniref:DoxX family protein n=1 Tax=Paraliomyxa miuraensis TaxID=376150 RepID=UPI002251CE0C|nr:DoxX family protein [Paraliomyxa miuraensis]MCX4242288.1 DoxX family protein [Paraliomyxa miuraensis]
MKHRKLAYWAATGLLALAFAAGGLFDLSASPEVVAMFAHLGYGAYVPLLLGVWKLLGAIAIVVPRMPRLKEWAYAGMVFDLTGAMVSHLAVGDAVGQLVAPLVLLGLVAASWALRPADRMLASTPRSQM